MTISSRTHREKVHAAGKANLLRAAQIAIMTGVIKDNMNRERVTIEMPVLKAWDDRDKHSTEPPLAGRRGKKTRRQRKAGR